MRGDLSEKHNNTVRNMDEVFKCFTQQKKNLIYVKHGSSTFTMVWEMHFSSWVF